MQVERGGETRIGRLLVSSWGKRTNPLSSMPK